MKIIKKMRVAIGIALSLMTWSLGVFAAGNVIVYNLGKLKHHYNANRDIVPGKV